MDMLDEGVQQNPSGSSLLPRVNSKPKVVTTRKILSRERPNSGAAVAPDPTATTAHRDDSYTPSGTSSRQSSRGLVKAAMRNATSASALETVSPEDVRKYDLGPNIYSGNGKKQGLDLSPPPSPPPLDPGDSTDDGLYKTKVIEFADPDSTVAMENVQSSEKGENDYQRENIKPGMKDGPPSHRGTKSAIKFEQPPHNNRHRRHIGGQKKNSSDSNVKKSNTQISSGDTDSNKEAPKSDSGGIKNSQNNLSLLNKKPKEKDKNEVVVARRRRTVGENGQFGEEKPLLPTAEMKKLLDPVVPPCTAAHTGSNATVRGHHHPKSGAPLTPLSVGAAPMVEDSTIYESGDDIASKQKDGDLAHLGTSAAVAGNSPLLAPLSVVPLLKPPEEDTARIPALSLNKKKEKGFVKRNNVLLHGVNRRHPRGTFDEEKTISAAPSAASIYMQAISPRGSETQNDGVASKGFGDVSLATKPAHGLPTSTDAVPPGAESMPSRTSGVQLAARKRRDRMSSETLPVASETDKVDISSERSKVDKDSGADGDIEVRKKAPAASKRTQRRSLGNPPGEVLKNIQSQSKTNKSSTNDKDSNDNIPTSEQGGSQLRPWSQTMELRLGEVEFMLRKPITSDKDIQDIFSAAKEGLEFMDQVCVGILSFTSSF